MTASRGTKILMDVDTGVDDAMALAMAVSSPEIELVGITTVAGNVDLQQATINTLRVLDYLGATDVPVYRGMRRPLTRDHFDAAHFHGHDGLGGAPFPDSHRESEPVTAPEFIVRTARALGGGLTLVFVGPLTNLAVALSLEPDLPRLVDRTVVMGGAFTVPGNATPFAEFNIAVDPEAAQLVAESGLDVTWIGLDVTHSANLYRKDWEGIGDESPRGALLVREVCRQSFIEKGHAEVHLHDPLALGVVLEPDVVKCRACGVMVDTSIRSSAGMTKMTGDNRPTTNSVAESVDTNRFRAQFGQLLGISID